MTQITFYVDDVNNYFVIDVFSFQKMWGGHFKSR